jgi:hypothetical protein
MAVKQVFNTSAELDFPNVLPTLDLDFANSKTLDPRITFTRSSGGSYVGADGLIKLAGVNEARFDHDPVTGESLGLLIEEARTNVITWSEDLGPDKGWARFDTNVVRSTDNIINPYGSLGPVYYVVSPGPGEYVNPINFQNTSSIGVSFFSKPRIGSSKSLNFFVIEIFQVGVGGGSLGTYAFNYNGVNPDSTHFKNIKTEKYPNGWYRFSCTVIARADYNNGVFGSNARFDIETSLQDNYIWGVQCEAGAFPTSYIPTQGSTRTRAADNARIIGKNFSEWYRQDEGTIYGRAKTLQGSNSYIAGVWGGSVQNRIALNWTSAERFFSGSRYLIVFTGNSSTGGTAPNNIFGQIAFAYKLYNNASSWNGGEVLISSPIGFPTFVRLDIGNNNNAAGNYLNGTISRLTYFPKKLPNSQLQALTS